jgi:hypothetical protein
MMGTVWRIGWAASVPVALATNALWLGHAVTNDAVWDWHVWLTAVAVVLLTISLTITLVQQRRMDALADELGKGLVSRWGAKR